MALIEQAIYTKITTDPTLNTWIGERCYIDTLPKKIDGSYNTEFPAIRYFMVDDPGEGNTHDKGPSSLARPRFQFDIYGPVKIDVLLIKARLRIILDGLQETVAGVYIQAAFKTGGGGLYEEPVNLYRQRMDFIFWYTQEV